VITFAAAAAMCLAGIGGTYNSYFTVWAQHEEVVHGYMSDIVRLTNETAGLPDGAMKYLVTDQGWLVDPVRFLADIPDAEAQSARHFQRLSTEEAMQLPRSGEESYFLLLRVDEEKRRALRAAMPNATFVR
jgi:hypothetical protein